MRYAYMVYFYPQEDEGVCRCEIPTLDIEFMITPENFRPKTLMQAAEEELVFRLYLQEQDGQAVPRYNKEATTGYHMSMLVEANTDDFRKHIVSIQKVDIT